jgi:excinuclease ABC subunit C
MSEEISIFQKDFLKNLPLTPGCYLYKDKDKKIIYIGKAKIIRKRVSQYFSNTLDLNLKTLKMIENSVSVSYIETDNELEALILESNLIKKYKPKYNILLKDDKRYAWIRITNDEFPKIERVREKINDGSKYFGPYPSGKTIIALLSNLRKIFPYRTCNLKIYENQKITKSRLCIFYDINLCPGPCDSLISKKVYMKNIRNIDKFLSGEKYSMVKKIEKQMLRESNKENFEKAGELKKQIDQINYITQNIKVDFGDDENIFKNKKEIDNIAALKELFEIIGVKYKTGRVECYDISNIQGKFPVSSMVVFRKGDMSPSYYRKFKIRSQDTPNDPLMMGETLRRRFTHKNYDESFSEIPDLIIVDGGKTQLNSGVSILKELDLDIPIVGLAKKREEIFRPGEKDPILIGYHERSHLLIRRIRDEAHRFAITFHRKLRSKGFISSK